MKKSVILASSAVLLAAISACVAILPSYRPFQLQATNPAPINLTPVSIPVSDATSAPEVGEFTLKELETVNPQGGCGMFLWKPTRERKPEKFVFVNGLKDEGMWMKIDGKMIKFQRIANFGEEFYGQTTTQTFQNEDKTLRVEVTVELGAQRDSELLEIAAAIARVERVGKVIELAVVGEAGC